MCVKFFGQFLIDQGEVDASDVREALVLMERENATLGQLAIAQGYLRAQDAARINAEQRSRDVAFGDLAVELGLLSPQQLVDLLQQQRSRRLPIGQALVRLGRIDVDRLGVMLDAYKADQAQYDVVSARLPEGLAGRRVGQYLIDLLPRFLMRIAQVQAKVGDVRCFEGMPEFSEMSVSVPIQGALGLEVALVTDAEFARAVARATSGLAASELDAELVADGVGEFLNVLAGNAASAATRAGHTVELGPPDYEAEPSHGWIVDTAVGVGRAALVLSPF
jgi:CheY-specific phosphatase CheX